MEIVVVIGRWLWWMDSSTDRERAKRETWITYSFFMFVAVYNWIWHYPTEDNFNNQNPRVLC